MKYVVQISMYATAIVDFTIEAESQEAAIAAGYDKALCTTPQNCTIKSIDKRSAVLDFCEAIEITPALVSSHVPDDCPAAALDLFQSEFSISKNQFAKSEQNCERSSKC
jgi:hypothetical protein